MEEERKWLKFIGDYEDENEALSLSDLPVIAHDEKWRTKQENKESHKITDAEEFEFRTWASAGLCAADEVFFRGQILPLRPSVSFESGDFLRSLVSSSSSRNSSCISRSQSSSSSEAPRRSVTNNFYAHPSPSPQLRRAKASNGARRSIGSAQAGWGLLRLGVVQAPEVEIRDLRVRRMTNEGTKSEAKAKEEEKKAAPKFWGLGFGCNCSPDSVETKSSRVLSEKKKKKKEKEKEGMVSLKRGESMMRQRRIFAWLEEQ